ELTYITPRGVWYHYSWKGNIEKSGGITTNIGIHFFDLLIWLFGKVQKSEIHISEKDCTSGFIELDNANIKWFLSINKEHLPSHINLNDSSSFRSIMIDGKEIEFTKGFTDLHTKTYEEILNGGGFGIKESRPSIELVYEIRNRIPEINNEILHPLAKKILLGKKTL
ncbi:MAG TPA: Gfo/Idh/MocA family oxidoreductase, partial [Ignavibacteriaceae bacterium]